jgi:hypothetical protein
MKMDLLESIGREYDWVLQTCSAVVGQSRGTGDA